MIIDLTELENTPQKNSSIEFDEVIEQLNVNTPVKGKLQIAIKGSTVHITGNIAAEISLECDRCLKVFLQHVDVNIDEKFVRGKIIDENIKDLELKSDNFVEELGDKTKIDLNDLIYQSITINMPTQKLCDINCEGTEELQKYIKNEPEDPRMQVFKDLKDKFKDS